MQSTRAASLFAVLFSALALAGCPAPSTVGCPAGYAMLPNGTCVCPSGTHELHATCVADADTGPGMPDTGAGTADAGTDAAIDGGSDSGVRGCDPWAELTPATHVCLTGERCAFATDGTAVGNCVPDGTVAIGGSCTVPTTGYDPCVSGARCDIQSSTCIEICHVPNAPCTAPELCYGDPATGNGQCFARCDMFDLTSADCAGGVCYAGRSIDGTIAGSCYPDTTGERAVGTDCSDSSVCAQGSICGTMIPSLFSTLCLPLCQGTGGSVHGCGSGLHCNIINGDLGVCQP